MSPKLARSPGPSGISTISPHKAPLPVPGQTPNVAAHHHVSRQPTRTGIATDREILGAYLYAITSGTHEKETLAVAQVILRRAGILGYAGLASYFASRDAAQCGIQRSHPRLLAFLSATETERKVHPGMSRALECARRVLEGHVPDLTRGAWFWEGKTLRQGGARHPRRQAGIRFVQPSHNLYHMADASRSTARLHQPASSRSARDAAIAFETTAAWGSSIFFRHPDAWLRANGVQPWKEYL